MPNDRQRPTCFFLSIMNVRTRPIPAEFGVKTSRMIALRALLLNQIAYSGMERKHYVTELDQSFVLKVSDCSIICVGYRHSVLIENQIAARADLTEIFLKPSFILKNQGVAVSHKLPASFYSFDSEIHYKNYRYRLVKLFRGLKYSEENNLHIKKGRKHFGSFTITTIIWEYFSCYTHILQEVDKFEIKCKFNTSNGFNV